MKMPKSYLIFADGACSGNPGPGGWGTVLRDPNGRVVELGGGERDTTNNRMELQGLLEGLKLVGDSGEPVFVMLDSVYVLRGLKEWIHGWKRNGFKTASGEPVQNQDIWTGLEREVNRIGRERLQWGYVPGHAGVPGNERVDKIAVAFSQGSDVNLFEGLETDYGVDLARLPESTEIPKMSRKNGKEKKAGWYLSLVSGVLEKHQEWSQCEARVKGRSGARFKKVTNETEEVEILRGWGVVD